MDAEGVETIHFEEELRELAAHWGTYSSAHSCWGRLAHFFVAGS